VNHARYLELLEEARWRLFEDRLGRGALRKDESPVVVVNVNIDYKAPAKLYDTLVIDTRARDRSATPSAVFRQRITIKENGAEAVDAGSSVTCGRRTPGAQAGAVGRAGLRELLEGLR